MSSRSIVFGTMLWMKSLASWDGAIEGTRASPHMAWAPE